MRGERVSAIALETTKLLRFRSMVTGVFELRAPHGDAYAIA
jgi:hypothetical protein